MHAVTQLTKLPAHIRPVMLGFGGLADGFMPFDATPSDTPSSTPPSHLHNPPCLPTADATPAHTAAAAAGVAAISQQEVTLPVCSLVMKAVQARLPGHLHTNSNSSRSTAAAEPPAGPTPSQLGTPSATPAAPTAAAAAVLASVHQVSAVKLGDGGLSKAQTDPRLPPDVRQSVLDDMQVMVCRTGFEGGKEGHVGTD